MKKKLPKISEPEIFVSKKHPIKKRKGIKFSEPEKYITNYHFDSKGSACCGKIIPDKPKCKMCEVWKWLYKNQGTFESAEQWRNSLVEFLEKMFL